MPPLFIIIEFIKGIVKQSDTRSSWWDRAIVKHVLVESNKWSKNRKRKQTNSDLVSSWDFICVPTSKCRWFWLPKTTTLYFEWKKAFPSSKKRKKSFSILSLKCIPRAFPPNRPFSRTHVIQNLFIIIFFFGLISLFSQQQEKITNKKVYLFLLTQESNIYAICLLLLFFASIVFFI